MFTIQLPKRKFRVRTILILGYWVLGNIQIYWMVLLSDAIFLFLATNTHDGTDIGEGGVNCRLYRLSVHVIEDR